MKTENKSDTLTHTKLSKGTVQVLPEQTLAEKITKKKRLTIKLGMDPTAPDLHLGHAVVLEKMRHFQDAGHHIIFLIGDFTALIGDPSGLSKTRPALSAEQIKKNAATYFEQVSKIIDPSKTEIRYNSEWLSKMSLEDWIKIAGKVTLARIIERDDFDKRLKENMPIGFHELFYPLMQGYDSVALKADVELGGTDQTFNLLMGRYLQESFDQEAQVIITMPLLEGLDGHKKMSKSLGNHIGLIEEPEQAFGKLMSISDKLMWRYYLLLLDMSEQEILDLQQAVKEEREHPMKLKKKMAHGVIAKFWSQDEAERAQKQFEELFQQKNYSHATLFMLPPETETTLWIIDLLKKIDAISSTSQGKRLIESGAVSLDGKKVATFQDTVTWTSGTLIKVGKHKIYKIK